MQPTPTANPSQMLPSNLLRGGQTTPGQIFPQNPLATGMSPSAMGGQPGLQPPPVAGSQAINQGVPPPMQLGQPTAGQPDNGAPQMSEAQMILNALEDRLQHHSKITEKTVSVLSDMIQAGLPQQGQLGQPTP